MEETINWKKILLRTVSYILVAALASCATLLFFGGNRKLAQLERVLKNNFVGDVNQTAMADAAANAMVSALGDRWSYYISADEMAAFKQRKTNTHGAIGITIAKREDGRGFDILTVEPDGAAGKAGVLPGDILIEAEGQSVVDMDSNELVQIIKGTPGTKVTIVVLRQEERVEFTITRETVENVVAVGELLPGNVGYVLIANFNTNSASQTLAVIEDLLEQGAEKLLFDVRDNPGGYVDELNEILDYLLPEGNLFRAVSADGKESVDKSDASCLEMPMAVLVNSRSYSCAEFFAAALREYDWATVVGMPTVGKGYFQNTFYLIDGSAVSVSTGQYYTPKGVSLAEEGGLVPDVTVEVDEETEALIYVGYMPLNEDPQVLAALEVLQ